LTRLVLRSAVILSIALLAAPAAAAAQPGDLGPVATLGRPGAHLTGEAIVLQADGRATVAGSDGRGFFVARVRPDGSVDRSFGRRGSLTVRFRGATAAGARDVALFRDGRILVAGTVRLGGRERFGVARLLPDGSLDPNFGARNGVAVAGPPGARLEAMALQPDGEIVLAGSVRAGPRRAVLVVRMLADGSPDPGFGTDGAVDSRPVLLAGRARDVLVQPDGRIALAAAVEAGRAARATFLAARLTPAGAWDRSFDGDGVARVATTAHRLRGGGAAALVPAPGGGLLLAGTARGGGGRDDPTLVRLTAAGRPARVTRLGGRSMRVTAMARDRHGRLLLGGTAAGLGGAVLRLRDGDRRDLAFAAGGLFGGRLPRTAPAALAARHDGAVVVAGSARIDGRGHAVVARLDAR
jgi:uncharacterized delta-60 repeat protein